MTAQASHNIYSTVDVYFISIIIIYKVTLTKSSGEPYDIVKDISDTFGLAKRFNFKRFKVHETKLYVYKLIFASFINLN